MGTFNPAILETAGQYLGEREFPGAKHNQTVLDMFETVGHGWVRDDETPWCAAFVGAVLAQLGLPHTGKLNARSYLDWGQEVFLRDVRPGDVCILSRGDPRGPYGHVAFVVRFDGGTVILRGGNQSNKVSDAAYPMSRVIGFRRAVSATPENGRPILRHGDRGAFVLDLQHQLRDLGYAVGHPDSIFGDKTRAAVLAFQGDNGLETDGIVGRMTWAALAEGQKRPVRAVTEADLRARGSRQIAAADKGLKAATAVEGTTLTTVSLGGALEMAAAAQRAEGALEAANRILLTYWPVLLVAVVVVVAMRYGKGLLKGIISNRVEDAQTGAHLGR